jgi:Holliday junction DNA helicase RuvA
MIGRLEGRPLLLDPGSILIDAGGVGYLVSVTLRAAHQLTDRERVTLWIHTRVKDDAIELYGFPERPELEAFERLIGVAGVGPRTALAVLSALTPAELAAAVHGGDAARLQKTPGVGTKTAQRIVLELRGQLPAAGAEPGDRRADAVSALVNLGYPSRSARRAVDAVLAEQPDEDLTELLRLALQRLTR